jgi:hypothetical protein
MTNLSGIRLGVPLYIAAMLKSVFAVSQSMTNSSEIQPVKYITSYHCTMLEIFDK